jgi:hypothetical protein
VTVFLAALVVFAVALAAMAVGVIFRYRCLLGTCGGLAGLQDNQGLPLCDACAARAAESNGPDENLCEVELNVLGPLPKDTTIPE